MSPPTQSAFRAVGMPSGRGWCKWDASAPVVRRRHLDHSDWPSTERIHPEWQIVPVGIAPQREQIRSEIKAKLAASGQPQR